MATRLTSNQKIVGSTPTVSALSNFRDSLMVRMGACRVPDRGSIPRRGEFLDTVNDSIPLHLIQESIIAEHIVVILFNSCQFILSSKCAPIYILWNF